MLQEQAVYAVLLLLLPLRTRTLPHVAGGLLLVPACGVLPC